MEAFFKDHGKPALIRVDNAWEFVAATLLTWLGELEIRGVFFTKVSPWQNGINERFNGTMKRGLFGHEVEFVVGAWPDWINPYPSQELDQRFGVQTLQSWLSVGVSTHHGDS